MRPSAEPSAIDGLFEDDDEPLPMPPAALAAAPVDGEEEALEDGDPSESPMARLDAMQAELDELRAMLA